MSLNESIVEVEDPLWRNAALTWFGDLGYTVGHGSQLAPGDPAAENQAP